MSKLHPFFRLKPLPYYCPKGEQMVNGGFEDGTNGWTFTSPAVIENVIVHSGSKSCKLAARLGEISQTLPVALLRSCITSFNLWNRVAETFDWTFIGIQSFYSDGSTYFGNDYFIQRDLLWHEFDLLSHLKSASTNWSLTAIRLFGDSRVGMHSYLDDISLIGKGGAP